MTKQNNVKSPTLLVMAGGTGGHIFPGLAVADALKEQGWNIHWLGTADRMEADIVPKHGYDISFIDIAGVRGKGLVSLLKMPFKLLKSVYQARQVIKRTQPDVVLGMGGYASGPGGLAAWLMKKPVVLHEQNAAAGLTNRLLARVATTICCAFPGAFPKNLTDRLSIAVVGNPLRAKIIARNDNLSTKPHSDSQNILVVGGSLGAQVLNQVVPLSFKALLASNDKYAIWHQTGKAKQAEVISSYHCESIASGQVKVTEFIADMALAYQWADLVICRAGALTVSEVAMASKPAIFVPLPHAVDDHQTKNAQYLVNCGAAKLLPQKELTDKKLTALVTELFTTENTLSGMAKSAYQAADKSATDKVANLCKQLLA